MNKENGLLSAFTLVVLAGCSTALLPDPPILSVAAYRQNTSIDDVRVAISPLVEKKDIKEIFGTDLLGDGTLPVLIVIENGSARENHYIDIEQSGIANMMSSAATISQVQSGTTATVLSATAVALALGPIITAPLAPFMLIAGSNKSANDSVINRQYRIQQLRRNSLEPGSQDSGFLYLPVRGLDPDESWALVVLVRRADGHEIRFRFPLTWVR